VYAIIDNGGRQYKVTSGQTIRIEKELAEDQTQLQFDRVLLIGGEGQPRVGTPTVAGATVTAEVVGPAKGPKLDIVKYRRRKGYYRKQGHRQPLVELKITAINA
jgi:large subunit ribosomal protein L21